MKKATTTKPVKKTEAKKPVTKKVPVVKKTCRRLTDKERVAVCSVLSAYISSAAWKKIPDDTKKIVESAMGKIRVLK